jgi:hypothetical protein
MPLSYVNHSACAPSEAADSSPAVRPRVAPTKILFLPRQGQPKNSPAACVPSDESLSYCRVSLRDKGYDAHRSPAIFGVVENSLTLWCWNKVLR